MCMQGTILGGKEQQKHCKVTDATVTELLRSYNYETEPCTSVQSRAITMKKSHFFNEVSKPNVQLYACHHNLPFLTPSS